VCLARHPLAAREALVLTIGALAGLPPEEARDVVYVHEGAAALSHVFRVASSLDSLVIGESEILGQVRGAFRTAALARSAGPVLDRVGRHAVATGRRVRRETGIGRRPISVPSIGVDLVIRECGGLAGRRALVIGSGDVARKTAYALRRRGVADLVVAARDTGAADRVADATGGRGVGLERLGAELARAEIVIAATGAPHHLVTRGAVERARAASGGRCPAIVVDLAVPRDVEPGVAAVSGVRLYDVDDVRPIADANRRGREHEIGRAGEIVAEEVLRATALLTGRGVRAARPPGREPARA
jgi:glutamyl-tRNA reductase